MKTRNLLILFVLAASAVQAREVHVAKDGSDANAGSEAEPLLTIQRAADLAQAGDLVTVHTGVYRERVNPPRGGDSDDKRIVYQAARGEQVIVKGSEVIKGWEQVQESVWKVVLPNSFFGDFNPYSDTIGGEWYRRPADGYNRHTGAVYLNGDWLDEAASLDQVLTARESSGNSPAVLQDEVRGGRTANYPGREIEATEEDQLYQSCRYNLQGYRLAVPNGTYRVTLKFCEPHFDACGKRVFDVQLQGKTALRRFDIFAKAGQFAAYDESFDGIEVVDGQLRVEIINRTSMACISAILIEGGGFSKRINCGGPAWKDYLPDPPSNNGDAFALGRPLWKAEVDEEQTTIWAQFRDVDPNREMVEINVRQSIFYPDRPGRNYITVRGFTMRQAATPWSGAMSEQVGLIGTHWSKGWIIEDNVISHSMNTGITLGRYDLGRFGIALPEVSAPGFVRSCELALEHGWAKENIGGHVVRNNHISHCEKNGIHGSLGGVFSTIEGNTICDIATRGWISGPDVAGLKLLGSQDVIIRDNHIYQCRGAGGVWLDWMAQGTRVTANLLHDNSRDLFMEVDHGPFLIDNNLFLSSHSLQDWSQGAAYVHNLIAGTVNGRKETRETPFFSPHSLENMQISNIQHKDLRFYNNLFVGASGLSAFDELTENLQASGNVYLAGAIPSVHERDAEVFEDYEPCVKLEEKSDGWWLEMSVNPDGRSLQRRAIVSTESLGTAAIPDARFEHPDGKPYRIETDYLGEERFADNPTPGPFRSSEQKQVRRKVWPKARRG